MATQGERVEALEKENGELKEELGKLKEEHLKALDRLSDVEGILKDGETLEELRGLVAKAAPLADFETLSETVAKHEATLAEGTAQLMDGEQPARGVVSDDVRGEVLKAFRQIEAIANHINVKLPA